MRLGIHFSHCFTVFLQFILINLLLSNMVCSDEVLWPTSDFFLTFSDEWWWGDVKESLKRSSYNTKCTIFYHSSIYIAIQNIQNVQYFTIPKYTKYTKYTNYTKYKYTKKTKIYAFGQYASFIAFCLTFATEVQSRVFKKGIWPEFNSRVI